MDDLIPSIDPDVEIDVVHSSDDEDIAPVNQSKKKASSIGVKRSRKTADISWDGFVSSSDNEKFESDEDDDEDNDETVDTLKNKGKAAASSWSFKEAIARIDATQRRSSVTTSLQDKIKALQQTKERQKLREKQTKEKERQQQLLQDDKNTKSVSTKKKQTDSSRYGDISVEDIEDVYEDEDDDEDDGDDDDDEATDNDDDDDNEDNDDDEDIDDDDDDDNDDDDDDHDEDEDDGDDDGDDDDGEEEVDENDDDESIDQPNITTLSSSSTKPVKSEADAMIASARPNPHRMKHRSADDALPPELAKDYKSFFEEDPFNKTITSKKSSATTVSTKDQLRDVSNKGTKPSNLTDKSSTTQTNTNNANLPSNFTEPTTFAEMNISRALLKAIQQLQYKEPTPIQKRAIPLLLAGYDICGSAVTGSGKTAAYLLPILDRLTYKPAHSMAAIRVLILVPTRELATQVHSMCNQLSQFIPSIRSCLIVGGLSLKAQEAELRSRPDIVIATPGRILDHIRNTMSVHCDDVDVLVLDEADRLLEMGFEGEVMEIVRSCPPGRQTMLFSATMTARVETLVKLSLRKPIRVTADPLYDMASRLVQEFIRVRTTKDSDRDALVLALLSRSFTGAGVLVFASHKRDAHRLAILCGLANLSAAELHGNLTQRQRLEALEDFRTEKVDILIATDLAGRGLDIPGVKVVINREMPKDLTSYVHRVGRTARAGRFGVAVTLVGETQRTAMKEIVKRATLNVRARTIPSDIIQAYRERVDTWDDDVEKILAAEREERELRLAERDTEKAENLIEHEDEIHARPARTWFMSGTEKQELQKASKLQALSDWDTMNGKDKKGTTLSGGNDSNDKKPRDIAVEHAKGHKLNRKKRRRMEAAKSMEEDSKRVARLEAQVGKDLKAQKGRSKGSKNDDDDGDDDDGPVGVDNATLNELRKARKQVAATKRATEGQYRLAKKAKAQFRSQTQKFGMSAGMVQKILKKDTKKKKKSSFGGGSGGGGAFATEKGQRRNSGGGGGGGGSSSFHGKQKRK